MTQLHPAKTDLPTAIWESWDLTDKEYYDLVKSISQRIQAVIKARGGATKFVFFALWFHNLLFIME